MTTREVPRGASWDFSKIPVFAPDRANRPQVRSSLSAPRLPGIIQPKLVVGEVNDPLEYEANRVADQVMRMPDPDLSITDAPPHISRKCAACEEEALQKRPNGPQPSEAEAPAIVHRVLRSLGQPLDAESRNFFEARFAHDFSQVQVHHGATAEESAREIDAHAYTVGRHIVFGAGEYAPSTTSGRRLLAHELTHVVQQSRGGLPVQRHPLLGLQRLFGNSYVDGLIQRREYNTDVPWWGTAPRVTSDSSVTFTPLAELWVGGRRVQATDFPTTFMSFSVTPGTAGVVRLQVRARWFQDNILFNYSGNGLATIDFPFTTTAEGAIDFQPVNETANTGGDAAELVIPVPNEARQITGGGTVAVRAVVRAEGSSTATSQFGFEEGAGGALGGEETTSRVAAWQQTFRVNIIVPRPQTRQVGETYTTDAHFRVGSHVLENERHPITWYDSLPSDVRGAIERGELEIELRGYASTTRGDTFNRELSGRRADRVEEILRAVASSKARFHKYPMGEFRARTGDEVESDQERRVEMTVTRVQTERVPGP